MPYRYPGPTETWGVPANFSAAFWQTPADIFLVAETDSPKPPAEPNSHYPFV